MNRLQRRRAARMKPPAVLSTVAMGAALVDAAEALQALTVRADPELAAEILAVVQGMLAAANINTVEA